MRMEIRNLNTFLKVAALRNFTQAGRELGYSQSNISAQIQQLEREVGVQLFNRIGKSVSLTQYGEELLPYAQQIVSTAVQMENFMRSEESLGGKIKIGIVESLFTVLPEELFLRYHERFPQVEVELTVDATELLKEHLRQGRLDAACLIDSPLYETEWRKWYSADMPVVIAASPSHPLAEHAAVQPKELEGQEFVLMEDSAPYNQRFQELLARQNVVVQPFLKLQSTEKACRLVEKGCCLSLLPLYAVKTVAEQGKIRILRILGEEQMQSVQIVLHKSRVVTPQLKGFMEEVRVVLDTALDGAEGTFCPKTEKTVDAG